MVQPVALSILLFVFAAQPLLSASAGGGCTARDGMCFSGEMAESRGEQLLQVGSAIKRPHKDAPDLGDDVVPKKSGHSSDVISKQSAKQKSSVDGSKFPSNSPSTSKRHSKQSFPSSKKSSISGDGGKKSSFGSLAKEVFHLSPNKSPAPAKADSKQHSAKRNRAKASGKVVRVSAAKDTAKKHSPAAPISMESRARSPKKMKSKVPAALKMKSKMPAALKRKSPSKSSRKLTSTAVKDQHALLSKAKGKATPKHDAKSNGMKAPRAATAKGAKEKVMAERRAPKSPGKAPATSSLKPAKGAGAGIKNVAPARALALKKQRSEPAGRGKGAGVSPAKGATASQTKVKPAKGTKLKSKVIVIAGGKKAKTKLAAKKGKAATRGKASKLKVSVVRGKAKSKKKQKSEDMEEEQEDMEEEEEAEVQQKSKAGTLFNPVIMSVVVLMSAPAGILLLGFGIFLWAKSQEDASMGANVDQ